MKKCENCKYFFYDYSTGTSECCQYDNMTEEETDKYYNFDSVIESCIKIVQDKYGQ